MHMDHRLIKASDFKHEAEFAVIDHHHHSRVYRAIALLFPSVRTLVSETILSCLCVHIKLIGHLEA